MDLKELKSKSNQLHVMVRIGKNGITDNTIEEISKNLKAHKLIKIKLLKSFPELENRKEIAKSLAEKTGSQLIQATGFTIVLHKR